MRISGPSAGLVGGVAVASFSKTLAVLFGLIVFGVQVGEKLRQLHHKPSFGK